MIAIENNDTKLTKFLLDSGAAVDIGVPITRAVRNKNTEIVEYLVEKGASLHPGILSAARLGNLDLLKQFYQRSMDKNTFTQNTANQALNAAAFGGQQKVIDWLLEIGVAIEPYSATQEELSPASEAIEILSQNVLETPLNQAAAGGNLNTVKFFQQKGASLTGALYFSLKNGRAEVAEYILQQDIDIQAEQKKFPDLIPSLIQHKNAGEMIRKLNKYFLNLHMKDFWGRPPILAAAEDGNIDAVLALLEGGVNPLSYGEKFALYIIDLVIQKGSTENIASIIQYVDQSVLNHSLSEYLMVTASNNSTLDTVKLLLDHGLPIDSRNMDGEGIIHAAANRGKKEIIQFAIRQGLDINQQTHDGLTPLMFAVMTGNIEILEFLLDHGADKTIRDIHQKSALDYTKEFKDQEMINLLNR